MAKPTHGLATPGGLISGGARRFAQLFELLLPLFEIALVPVRLDHVASLIVNANHSIMHSRCHRVDIQSLVANRLQVSVSTISRACVD